MNTLVANAHREAELVTLPELDEICGTIRRLGELYGNADNAREEAALRAASAGRAAWWVSCRYHNQAAMLVALYANDRTLAAALDAFADDRYPSPSRHRAYLIEHMIPLNDKARAEKAKAVSTDVKSRGEVA